MHLVPHRRWARIVAVALIVVMFIVGGYGVYLASLAGALPWQTEPTRIPITPFAGIPGFDAPTPAPTRTAAPASPTLTASPARAAFEIGAEPA